MAFDLTGLPPRPDAVDRFVSDPASDAYERLVDELLASPAYGERWGRHWLDAAGYADSDGFSEKDLERKGIPYKVVGGSDSGVLVKNSWMVCATNPLPHSHLESGTTIFLIAARSCK